MKVEGKTFQSSVHSVLRVKIVAKEMSEDRKNSIITT